MAQPTQWAPAILDYMKKVKLSISTSHPCPSQWYISSHVQYHNYTIITVQWLSCRFDECVEGGESVLLDAFAVVEELREKQPHLFDTLARVPATFERIHYNRLVDSHTASYSISSYSSLTVSINESMVPKLLLTFQPCFSHRQGQSNVSHTPST